MFLAIKSYLAYHKNTTSFEVKFRRFHRHKNDVYPSISMCFSSPFPTERLSNLAKGILPTNYSNFLLGNTYKNDLKNIDYDNVSLQLHDFLASTILYSKTKDNFNTEKGISTEAILSTGLNVYVWRFLKCFTLDIPFEENIPLNGLLITIKRSVFPKSMRPMDGWDNHFGLSLFYHLPNQLFTSYSTRKIMWPKESTTPYSTVVYVSNVEIFKRRRHHRIKCIKEPEYDNWFLKIIGL